MIVARIPPVHIFVGKLEESPASHGTPPSPFFSPGPLHRWQMPGNVPLLLRRLGLPATIRNPYVLVSEGSPADKESMFYESTQDHLPA